LEQAVAERDERIGQLEQAVAERDERIDRLGQTIAQREEHIAAIYASTSWCVTWPLRIIGHQLRRIQYVFRLIKSQIDGRGGLRKSIRKVVGVCRGEGLVGVKRARRVATTLGQIRPASGSGPYDRNDYTEWIRRYDTIDDEVRAIIRMRIESFREKPLISVLMPTYNSKPEWLIQAIESVRSQIYQNWELCIADDASTDPRVRHILKRYMSEDPRIKVVFREINGHIAAASNNALELVTGDWVALLDHDDLLAEHALFWVVDTITKNPDVRMIYSDEDKIDENGKRFGAYLKCDWNIDLFYSQNLFSHLGVYCTSLVREVAGFREGFEGSQDYDLALRCSEKVKPIQIYHVPKILYHWRAHNRSTAEDMKVKPYASVSAKKALDDHFSRVGIQAETEILGSGTYRVQYHLSEVKPMVTLVIVAKSDLQNLLRCVRSILSRTRYPRYGIIVIDNETRDPLMLKYLDQFKHEFGIRLIQEGRQLNYSALNNAAVKLAEGEIVCLLGKDTEVINPGWLSEMVSHALRPEVGGVGAKLCDPDGKFWSGGMILGIGKLVGHAHRGLPCCHYGYFGRAGVIQTFSAISSACLCIRKEIYEKVGGFDENGLPADFGDVDFCLRVREAGYRNIWTPFAELYHHRSLNQTSEHALEKQMPLADAIKYMKNRWGNSLSNDPAYSPNLTLEYEDFSLAWPPRVELLGSRYDGI